MLALTEQILRQYGDDWIRRIKENILNVNTGNYVPRRERQIMADSLVYEITPNTFKIYGGKWVFTYEFGRGPTVNGGDGAVRRNALEYIKEEGIVSKYLTKDGKSIDQSTLAFFISRKIHQEGTTLYRNKTRSGVISGVINDEEIDKLLQSVFFDFIKTITSTLLAK